MWSNKGPSLERKDKVWKRSEWLHKDDSAVPMKRTGLKKSKYKLKKKKKTIEQEQQQKQDIEAIWQVFREVWSLRPHKSEVSGTYIWGEPCSWMFHHIIPKSKYPEAKYDKHNIIILTFDEHQQVEQDMYKYEEVNKRRELLKIKYGI